MRASGLAPWRTRRGSSSPTSPAMPRAVRWMPRSTTPSIATTERGGDVNTHPVPERNLSGLELLREAAEAAASKKAIDVVGLDLSGLERVADFFLICSGSSEPQVKAIAEAVE